MVIRIFALIMVFPLFGEAQTDVVGYGGVVSRVQAERFDFETFRGGPASTQTPAFGFGGGTSIWKVRIDGSILRTQTGETNVFVGPVREVEQTAQGSALFAEFGAGWPFLKAAGFRAIARAGIGAVRVRVPMALPIEDDQRFWTYGISVSRPVGSRYLIRIDARNVHFQEENVPQTLGRYNVIVLAGFGLRF